VKTHWKVALILGACAVGVVVITGSAVAGYAIASSVQHRIVHKSPVVVGKVSEPTRGAVVAVSREGSASLLAVLSAEQDTAEPSTATSSTSDPSAAAGPEGPEGPAGLDGADGAAGADGAQGPEGPAGRRPGTGGAAGIGRRYRPGRIGGRHRTRWSGTHSGPGQRWGLRAGQPRRRVLPHPRHQHRYPLRGTDDERGLDRRLALLAAPVASQPLHAARVQVKRGRIANEDLARALGRLPADNPSRLRVSAEDAVDERPAARHVVRKPHG